MDDYIRDIFSKGEFKKLSHIEGKNSGLAGQSLWNFIAENYGVSNISNILNLTRIIRNEQNSIANTLGMPFKVVVDEWMNYYGLMAQKVEQDYIFPTEGRIRKKNKNGYTYSDVKISPDGRYLAYSENFKGKYKVYVRDLERGKQTRVHQGGYKVINQEFDLEIPVLSWQDDNNLGIINSQYGRNVLWIVNVGSGRKLRYPLARFNQIKSFDFSTSGNLIVMSADINGRSDIFLYSISRATFKRLTNDIYDDLHPRFIPSSNGVVFSSNRVSDTLSTEKIKMKDLTDNYNLFIYSLDTTKNVLYRITNTLSKDFAPIPQSSSSYYYLSDQKGILNIYNYTTDNSIYKQVTNYGVSVKDYDLNLETGTGTFVMINNGAEFVFTLKDIELDKNKFTPLTRRQELEQAKYISRRIIQREREQRLQRQQLKEEEIEVQQRQDSLDLTIRMDSVSQDTAALDDIIPIDSLLFGDDTPQPALTPQPDLQSDEEESLTGIIDTDTYVFDLEIQEEKTKPRESPQDEINSFLGNYRRLRQKEDLSGPFDYQTLFTADNLITSVVVDPLLGFGVQLEAQMNDILENHKFFGGLVASADLRNSEFYGEYQFLKYRLDLNGRYERRSLLRSNQIADERYISNTIQAGVSLPLSIKSRISFSPFYRTLKYYDLDPRLLNSPNQNDLTESTQDYLGGRFELVYDNTIVRGLNLFEGTRAKASFTHHYGLTGSDLSFSNINVDIRHYQKIHREFVLALRGFYGRFFGDNKQSYILGGVDNWLFNDTEQQGEGDPLFDQPGVDNSNILFVEYVTSLRGFDYNILNGSNALLFNAELRMPIFQYLSRGTISSNFLRNLQIVGFYDVGSAWTGKSPFSSQNDLNTKIIERNVFRAKINNFSNPWLQGYGWGLRTVLLGYYMKFDVAWPVEDFGQIGNPKFYLSLGYDF
jgi:Tol biopolymer transport system component